ncbi:sterigmatocystin 8-O-methyltransferase [Annulohypoxylon truncatum]|uniref:sterigmatocystin 8-O-methyltransferase n=1 Tax=Annulohypoxylon truncatum TaxID=327061 RepID=UPI0020082B2C|nr:sterigmatocystin 8-O-methyltransferase [Annulohypoxylon truncatum]KAI1204466.1 sterigmatocystin 8-O-methyltransferase [Annulohypoxylon truncatum]
MASPNDTPRIVELATQISASVNEMQKRLSDQGVPSPTFGEDSPQSFPADVYNLRTQILDATAELNEVLTEPLMLIFKFAAISNLVSIDTVCRLGILDMVPAGGKLSFAEVAEKTGLSHAEVRRVLRHVMAMRILQEPEPEMVAHTKVSKFMSLPHIQAWVQFEGKDTWPACARVADALEKWPASDDFKETGFALANDGKSVFEVLHADPERAMRFGNGMKSLDHVPGCGDMLVSKAYDWSSLGNTYIVNVGGAKGIVAMDLAKHFEKTKFLVQDGPMMIKGAEVPEELKGRVDFMEHELFAPQTVQADVYFFRMAFRNWNDKNAVNILKAQVPALRPGAKLLIQDKCMTPPNTVPISEERIQRAIDMSLKTFFNTRDRYLDDWKALLAAADERFVLHRVVQIEGSLLSMLEVHWDVSSAKA